MKKVETMFKLFVVLVLCMRMVYCQELTKPSDFVVTTSKREEIKQATDFIDKHLKVPKNTEKVYIEESEIVSIDPKMMVQVKAFYLTDSNKIVFNKKVSGAELQLSIIHELFHWIDEAALKAQYKSPIAASLTIGSPVYKMLEKAAESGLNKALLTLSVLDVVKKDVGLNTHITYLLTPHEMFARMSTQWFVLKYASEEIKKSFDLLFCKHYPLSGQYTKEEFSHISPILEDLYVNQLKWAN